MPQFFDWDQGQTGPFGVPDGTPMPPLPPAAPGRRLASTYTPTPLAPDTYSNPFKYAGNDIGTMSIYPQQELRNASPFFSPLVDRPYASHPVTLNEANAIEGGAKKYSLDLFGQAALAGGGEAAARAGGEGGPVALGRIRNTSVPAARRAARAMKDLEPEEVAPLRPGEKTPPLTPVPETMRATSRDVTDLPVGERGLAGVPSLRNMTPQKAAETAAPEPHLIPKSPNDPDGGFVGAPAWVRNRADIEKMRRDLDADIDAGAHGRDWYERARATNAEITGTGFDPQTGRPLYGNPQAARDIAEGQGVFSPQADPNANWQLYLNARNAYERGIPNTGQLGGQTARLKAYNEGRAAKEAADYPGSNLPPPDTRMGKKTEPFAGHLSADRPYGVTGTNDRWHARSFGYTNADGSEFDRAPTDQEHKFMDYETVLAGKRAEDRQSGGFTTWNAAQIQAAPWVANKEASLRRRYPLWSDAKVREEALKTFSDVIQNTYAYIPTEQVPGYSTGLYSMLPESDYARWSEASKWADPKSGQDMMTWNLLHQPKMAPTTGTYINTAKQLETNPGLTAYPTVDFLKGTVPREIHPGTAQTLASTQYLRGLIDLQEGSPYNFIDLRPAVNLKDRTAMMLTGPQASPQQIKQIAEIADRHGYFTSDTGKTGIMLIPDKYRKADPSAPNQLLPASTGKDLKARLNGGLAAELDKVVPGVNIQTGAHSGYYADLSELLAEANKGQGGATEHVLNELAKMQTEAPRWYEKVLDNPKIALKAQQNYDRLTPDMIAKRPDYANMLRIIAEGKVRGLVNWVKRRGSAVGLPAALAAIAAGREASDRNKRDER